MKKETVHFCILADGRRYYSDTERSYGLAGIYADSVGNIVCLKGGLIHNTKRPAWLQISTMLWYINGYRIEEFTSLCREDLSEAQKKKLEFY